MERHFIYKAIQGLCKLVSSSFALYIFLINLLSNIVSVKLYNNVIDVSFIVFLSAFTAYIESSIYYFIRNSVVKKIYASIIVIVHNVLAIVEHFILVNFQTFINQDIIDIICDTNPVESSNFIATYLQPHVVLLYLVACILINVVLVVLVKLLGKIRYKEIALALSVLGLFTLSYCAVNFVKYRNGMSIPQLTTLSRLGYSLYCAHQRIVQTDEIRNVCENEQVSQNIKKKPTIIVIIGESFSVYHSSLYGYKKNTNPMLSQRVKDGSLYVFDNAVTLWPATTASMCADFSLDSLGVGYTTMPMFPACFKKAGYYTAMYDNQYFVGQGISFLSDKKLSDAMFDYRNSHRYDYDLQMINTIKDVQKPSLYVIHLWGQHYTYKDRFPKDFAKFKADEYNKNKSNNIRQIMANYDNATLYNDFVVNSIIDKFKNDYCCVFYFSDHGEEVYELRNYMGHGNAYDSPNPNYQIRVPLMVWTSPSFAKANPAICNKFDNALHYPICMDDIGHTLLDIAGITCKDFAPARSFVNDKFNIHRHRVVMNSIDYDKLLIHRR